MNMEGSGGEYGGEWGVNKGVGVNRAERSEVDS